MLGPLDPLQDLPCVLRKNKFKFVSSMQITCFPLRIYSFSFRTYSASFSLFTWLFNPWGSELQFFTVYNFP